jgi:hypothetical protein
MSATPSQPSQHQAGPARQDPSPLPAAKAPRTTGTVPSLLALQEAFLTFILPRVVTHGQIVFRHIKCQSRREDCIEEMVALAWKWHLRLSQKGKDATLFPSAIATFAARAVRCGRKLVGMDRAKDALSPRAQQRHGFVVCTLPTHSTLSATPFSEALADNTRTPPPDAAAFRCDFPEWLASLGERNRRLAEDLALGYRTTEVAEKHKVTQGRVSQLRRFFFEEWGRFCGDAASGTPA